MIENHEQLKKLVYEGAREKKLVMSDIVLDRITYELSIIEKQGFTDYFILFSRIIETCNELNLLRSYGRGSAANSLVNYCLDITKINSIDENLIFERFILPQQKQLPDVDIDIPKGFKELVIEKLKKRYPEYNSYCIAFSPQSDVHNEDIIYNTITYKKHQSGIIITPKKLTDSIFFYDEQEFYLSLDPISDPIYKGKIDFIESEYLFRLQIIVNEIGNKYHPYKLPLNDKNVFDFFKTGNLENIFSFYNPYLTNIFSKFKPDSIKDLSIIYTLFRPSIMKYFPNVINNKFNQEERFYSNESRVSKILNETFGLMIYEESFLHISKEIAGIPFLETEVWSKIIKRDKDRIALTNFSTYFANGCRKNSTLSECEIESLTNHVVIMLPLTFQKSHSLSHSIIGYWGAFYKTHFRTQFEKAFSIDVQFQTHETH